MKTLAIGLKQLIGGSILGLAICLVSLPSQSLTVKEVPNPRQLSGVWVTDMAEILKPETEAQLNQMINRLENKNGAEIAIVTVPETKPAASPKTFATELFNYWHIGKKDRDNGVLFLISKGDRRVEIETGYGVESILPDAKVGSIIDTEILPRFKKSDFDGGTLAGTRMIVVTLEPSLSKELQTTISFTPSRQTPNKNAVTQNNQTPQDTSASAWIWFSWLLLAVLAPALWVFFRGDRIPPTSSNRGSSFFGGGGNGGGNGGGGDSGSFGGGDSGGGGAGGSW